MTIELLIKKYEEKYSTILIYFIIGSTDKELRENYKAQMNIILEIISDLKKVEKNLALGNLADFTKGCEHNWAYSHTDNVNSISYCSKCQVRKVNNLYKY